MPNVVALGTGTAGFGAAHRLREEGGTPIVDERNSDDGGRTMPFRHEPGFVVDVGPHVSFTKDERIRELFADSVDQLYEAIQINLNNHRQGYSPRHRAQLHLKVIA